MGYFIWFLRGLLALAAALLTAIVIVGVLRGYDPSAYDELSELLGWISRSLLVSVPLVPFGVVVSAIWGRWWPLPVAAFLWTIGATILTEPSEFDFVFTWLLGAVS